MSQAWQPYLIQNVTPGVLLEVRIKKGANIIRQESLVRGATAGGTISPAASLQVRERNFATGKATPWETIIKAAPARTPAKKKPKKKPKKKKTKKSTPKKKAKKKRKKPAKKKGKKKAKKAARKNPCPPRRKK